MHIRKAKLTDYKAIADLTEQLGYPNDAEKLKATLTIVLSHQEYQVWVGVIDDKIVGWMQLQRTITIETGVCVEIIGLVVDIQRRGQGLGGLFIEKALRWSKTLGCFRLRVRCNILRTESHQFYEKMGFSLKKKQKVFDIML